MVAFTVIETGVQVKGKEQTAEVCLLPVAAMLGRQEYILRTVTFVERYHSGVSVP